MKSADLPFQSNESEIAPTGHFEPVTGLDVMRDLQFWIDHPSLDSAQLSHRGDDCQSLQQDIDIAWNLLQRFAKNPRSIIGAGAFGIVFKAFDEQLKREVAIKILRDSARWAPSLRSRFVLEAESMARCAGEGVVHVYEHGKLDDIPYIVMQLVDGPNLREYLLEHRRPFEPSVAARLLMHVSSAVHGMHQRAILHRDLKPSNILLEKQGESAAAFPFRPFVSDFGFVKQFQLFGTATPSSLSFCDSVVGTVKYMSPEQASGQSELLHVGTDVFSLGVILYELLTLQCPFQGPNSIDVLNRIVRAEPASIRNLNALVPRELEAIVFKCLQKRIEDRYSSAGELALDLERFLSHRPTLARPVSLLKRSVLWSRRNRLLAAQLTAVSIAIPTVMATLFVLYQSERSSSMKAQESAQLAVGLARETIQRLAEEYREQEGGAFKRLELHQAALKAFEKLAEIRKHDAYSRHQLSIAYHWVATAQGPAGFMSESIATRKKGFEILEALVREYPNNEEYRYDRFYNRMVLAPHHPDCYEQLLLAYDDIRLLCTTHPESTVYFNARSSLESSIANSGCHGDASETERFSAMAIRDALELSKRFPDKPIYLKPARDACMALGTLYSKQGQVENMHVSFEQALDYQRQIATTAGLRNSWISEELHLRMMYVYCIRTCGSEGIADQIEACLPLFEEQSIYRVVGESALAVQAKFRLWLATDYWRQGNVAAAQRRLREAEAIRWGVLNNSAVAELKEYAEALTELQLESNL